MTEPQPVVLADVKDVADKHDREFVTSPKMFDPEDPQPTFSVNEAAKVFFGKSGDWLRWRSRPEKPPKGAGPDWKPKHPHGYFVLDGVPLEENRTEHHYRYYTLYDIERMAHALGQNGAISGAQVKDIIDVVKGIARIYGYIQ